MEGHASRGHENHALTSPKPGDGGPRAGPGASAGGGGTVPGPQLLRAQTPIVSPSQGETGEAQPRPLGRSLWWLEGAWTGRPVRSTGGPCVAGGAAEDRRTPSGRDADRPAGYGGHSGPDLAAWTSDPPRRRGHGSRPAVPGPLTATVSLGDRLPARRRGLPGGLPERCWEVGARGGPAEARPGSLAGFTLGFPSAGLSPPLPLGRQRSRPVRLG